MGGPGFFLPMARRNEMKTRDSLYETITNGIIAELEQGVAPWVKPWTAGIDGMWHLYCFDRVPIGWKSCRTSVFFQIW